jgi:predicted Na+-dependent transporter
MLKKISILLLLIILPNILAFIYDNLFRYSGNFLEDYQNYFKIGFIVVSIISTIWLMVISKKGKNYIWFGLSLVLLVLLLIYLYLGLAVINMSISF